MGRRYKLSHSEPYHGRSEMPKAIGICWSGRGARSTSIRSDIDRFAYRMLVVGARKTRSFTGSSGGRLANRVPVPGKLENRARSHHVFTAAKHTTDIVHVGRSLLRIEHDHGA